MVWWGVAVYGVVWRGVVWCGKAHGTQQPAVKTPGASLRVARKVALLMPLAATHRAEAPPCKLVISS